MSLGTENFSYATFLSADYGKSVGSGFMVSTTNGNAIVTARHVVFDDDKPRADLLVTCKNYKGGIDDYFSMSVNLRKAEIREFGGFDIVLINLIDESYDIAQEAEGIIKAEIGDLSLFRDVKIASNVLLVGFPYSLINPGIFDVDRPLLRAGIIAGINTSNNTFIIDTPAFYGNSGGPVLQLDGSGGMSIVGIVSKYIPFVTEWRNKHERAFTREEFYNSGYAVCIPLDEVLQSLKN